MQKLTGEIRRLETLNRIVLPAEMRESNELHANDLIQMYIKKNGEIVLEKYDVNKAKKENNPVVLVRKLDEIGRIVIPKPTIKAVGLKTGDLIEFVYGAHKEIILRKIHDDCVFCGGNKNTVEFERKLICKKCLEKIKETIFFSETSCQS